jgi:hypothetical protein
MGESNEIVDVSFLLPRGGRAFVRKNKMRFPHWTREVKRDFVKTCRQASRLWGTFLIGWDGARWTAYQNITHFAYLGVGAVVYEANEPWLPSSIDAKIFRLDETLFWAGINARIKEVNDYHRSEAGQCAPALSALPDYEEADHA